MKTFTTKITVILFLFVALVACNKEETILEKPIAEKPVAENTDPENTPSENSITGTVVLPAGSAVDVNSLNIASPIGQVAVTDGNYEMNTLKDKFLTQLVTDTNGEVLLMGYTYPGQTDFDINATSTVLAILMNMPTSLISAREAKLELITLFLNDANFKNVVNLFEKMLLEGKNPLDISNTLFTETIELFYRQLLLPQANKSGKLEYSFDPVDVRVTNNKITFANLGKTYETVIGIYKDDVKIENINVERITFIPTTVGDAIGAFASAYGGTELSSGLQPVEYTYTFENDGQYDIKIRTSKLADDAIENDIALLNNITNWGVDLILEILPLGDCVQPAIANFKQHVQTFGAFSDATTEQEKLGLLYDVLYTFFNDSKTLISCLGSADEFDEYMKKFSSLFKFLDLVGKIGNGGNILLGIAQLVADEGKMDLCYNVAEGIASECDVTGVYVAGFEYNDNDIPVATVWKNGVATSLTDGSKIAYANSVYVTENDVYVAGWEMNESGYSVAKVWKNGVVTTLAGNNNNLSLASSVFVLGNNVYVSGEEVIGNSREAKVWKNGMATPLADGAFHAQTNSIYVLESDVYVAGSLDNSRVSTIWKNGVATSLTNGISYNVAKSVYVSGSDVYVAGHGGSDTGGGGSIAKVWKNGVVTWLTNNSYEVSGYAHSVYVSENDVYVVGEIIINGQVGQTRTTTIWKNGVATSLTDGLFANSVYVSGSDVYVAGVGDRGAMVWKNGLASWLTDGNKYSNAKSIFVKE